MELCCVDKAFKSYSTTSMDTLIRQ